MRSAEAEEGSFLSLKRTVKNSKEHHNNINSNPVRTNKYLHEIN